MSQGSGKRFLEAEWLVMVHKAIKRFPERSELFRNARYIPEWLEMSQNFSNITKICLFRKPTRHGHFEFGTLCYVLGRFHNLTERLWKYQKFALVSRSNTIHRYPHLCHRKILSMSHILWYLRKLLLMNFYKRKYFFWDYFGAVAEL